MRTEGKAAVGPGDFQLGSLESRAAARAMLKRSATVSCVVITTGLPLPLCEKRVVVLPDSLAYYLAADDSVVSVIFRENENKLTAFVDQTWNGGKRLPRRLQDRKPCRA